MLSDDCDLDIELKKDPSGAFLKKVKDGLQENLGKIKRAMDRGVPKQEFAQAQALQKAFEAASSVVETTWNGFHRR